VSRPPANSPKAAKQSGPVATAAKAAGKAVAKEAGSQLANTARRAAPAVGAAIGGALTKTPAGARAGAAVGEVAAEAAEKLVKGAVQKRQAAKATAPKNTDKDGVLLPVNKRPKPSTSASPKLDKDAQEKYGD
jgi:hypothetical protein